MGGYQVKAPNENDSATKKEHEGLMNFQPDYPEWYQMFKAQAGSMTNLTEEAILTLIGLTSLEDENPMGTYDWRTMKQIFWILLRRRDLICIIYKLTWRV